MDFTGEGENRMTYGASLAAALTLLMLRQGDQVGLGVFDKEVRNFIPPRGNARHFGAIVDALEHIQPGEDTNISGVLHQMAERVRRRSMVIIISDFFDDVEPILNSLQHFRHRHNEVIVLHLLDEIELTFPFDRVTLFEGMKRGGGHRSPHHGRKLPTQLSRTHGGPPPGMHGKKRRLPTHDAFGAFRPRPQLVPGKARLTVAANELCSS